MLAAAKGKAVKKRSYFNTIFNVINKMYNKMRNTGSYEIHLYENIYVQLINYNNCETFSIPAFEICYKLCNTG